VLRESGVELPPAQASSAVTDRAAPAALPLAQQRAALEREAISAAMAQVRGNKAAAARLLGISRATLYGRLGNSVQ